MTTLARWLLIALLCLAPVATAAQDAPADPRARMEQAYARYEALRDAKPAEALPHLVTAVNLADQVHGYVHPTTLAWREALVKLYEDLDRPANATFVAKATAQRLEMDAAAKQYAALKDTDPAKALHHLETVVLLADPVLGVIHQGTLNARQALADLYRKLGRDGDAAAADKVTAPRTEVVREYQQFFDLRQDKPAEALPHLQRVAALVDGVFGHEHQMTLHVRQSLAELYRRLGRDGDAAGVEEGTRARTASRDAFGRYMALRDAKPAEALPHLQSVVDLADTVYGPVNPTTIQLRNTLAALHQRLKRYDTAEEVYKATLARVDGTGPQPHPELADTWDRLGFLYREQDRYPDAIAAFERALALAEQALGPDHPDVAWKLEFLAGFYQKNGDYPAAEKRFKRALAILEKVSGPDSVDLANPLNNLAALYHDRGRFAEAEPLYRRAIALYEKEHGPDHPDVAGGLNNLAATLNALGRYDEAETLYLRALDIREKALGPDHPDVATSLNSLAGLYWERGDFEAAEIRYKRALAILEKATGRDPMEVAGVLNNLALLIKQRCRFAEAEPLYLRALGIMEKYLGPDHPSLAVARANLATLHQALDRRESAERLLRQSLESRRKVLRPDHPDIAVSLQNLGTLLMNEGKLGEAEQDLRRAQEIFAAAYGPDHPRVADVLNNLAGLHDLQDQHDSAEKLYRQSLALRERLFGDNHPLVEVGLENLASHYVDAADVKDALPVIRRATDAARARLLRATAHKTTGHRCERNDAFYGLRLHLRILAEAIGAGLMEGPVGRAEGFQVAQLIAGGSAAQAVARMAARFAAGGDALAELVRNRQNAGDAWQKTDLALTEALAQPPAQRDAAREDDLRRGLSALDREIAFADRELAVKFPAYRALANPEPLTLDQARALLGPDEALMVVIPDQARTYAFMVRHDRSLMAVTTLGAEDLDDVVREMRDTLDPTGVVTVDDIRPFDVETAHELYDTLFGAFADMLTGVRHLFVVPDGGLRSLPLGVLVTDKPQGPVDDFDAYRRVPWLARKYALTVLPSVASLRSLRLFAGRARASRPFTGIGDPAFGGRPGAARGLKAAKLFTARGLADTRAVAALPRLPDTADELRAIAQALGAGDQALVLGTRATETAIKAMDLSDSRVVAFATHGLMAGDFEDLGEPALALTPPDRASAEDDGLLTAGEAARLKLNADWVVLSACNTAADDGTPGADGLSGLARAFFHAGARALLVSHWPVNSEAASRLTSRAFAIAAAEPGIGRSEAFTRSMLELMDDDKKPYFAHPMFWAPFSVIGEGGTYRP
ncbi:MAG: tetratricopeptide repeat protein [Hyphomicrobiales bacterium]|nr:tetratricopeptide repeat protein [Hyphomicrobiales bacterium]MCP5373295.1 tetratricopeptide repeat protein [Hyphomicrobiales bacterium]